MTRAMGKSDGTYITRGDLEAEVEAVLTALGWIDGPALEDHESDSTNVHGIIDTANLVTKAELASKADDSDLLAHETDTTGIHGIENTANLLTTSSAPGGLSDVSGTFHNLQIRESRVTSTEIAGGAVEETKLANEAVGSGKIKNLAVTEGKLAANSVVEGKIANSAISAEKLAASAKRLHNQLVAAKTGSDHPENYGRFFMNAGTGTVEFEHGLSGITNQESLIVQLTVFNTAAAPTVADVITVQEVTSTKVKVRRNATTQTILVWWTAIKD